MEVLRRPARQIMDKVLDVLESTTPELVADIARNGIVLTGGGSQLFGMDRLLCERTEMTCVVADDTDSCVALTRHWAGPWPGSAQCRRRAPYRMIARRKPTGRRTDLGRPFGGYIPSGS